MNVRRWLLTSAVLITCAFMAGAWLIRLSADAPPPPRRDFTLTDTANQKVTLATYEGKWLLMFFGFIHCPDACPTAMITVGHTLKSMGSQAAALQPIFITIDPARDSPSLLKEYLANFEGGIVGLSGSEAETKAVAKAYGVFYQPRASADGPTMDHSTAFYLVSPKGEYVRPFRADIGPEQLARDIMAAMMPSPEINP